MDYKQRFSDRVENYIKYRPGYPDEIIPTLQLEFGLMDDDIVADIGSGTGISSKLFLENGNTVYGVEPNEPMRKAAEGLLSVCLLYTSPSPRDRTRSRMPSSA